MIHRHEPLKPDDLKADFAYQTIVLVKRAECNVDAAWHLLVDYDDCSLLVFMV